MCERKQVQQDTITLRGDGAEIKLVVKSQDNWVALCLPPPWGTFAQLEIHDNKLQLLVWNSSKREPTHRMDLGVVTSSNS